MTVIPIPRRSRTFSGPHHTCMDCADSHMLRLKRTSREESCFDMYRSNILFYGLLRFILLFCASMGTFLSVIISGALFLIQYSSIHVFLRFQYKLTVLLIMINRDRFNFHKLNEGLIYCIHVVMLLLGGLGWCAMMFVDI
uniref:Protein C9orf69-like n=1 Tax=Saccoglossus kowalevskii TaxID=10224 RepID=A0ABM0LUT9_SACKO|nr:PREDICTED: protein C9orf69-like [Saccoglossus kowalevskii]